VIGAGWFYNTPCPFVSKTRAEVSVGLPLSSPLDEAKSKTRAEVSVGLPLSSPLDEAKSKTRAV